jgi:hypothetical protein
MSTLRAALGWLASKIWGALRWLGRGLARPYQQGAQGPSASSQRNYVVVFLHIFGDDLLVAIGILVCSLAALVLAALLYGKINDIPSLRVIVGIVGAAIFWAIIVGQLRYWFRTALGEVTSRIFAISVAFILAVPFGMWLMNWTFLDKFFALFT